jgi:hypothetical protein
MLGLCCGKQDNQYTRVGLFSPSLWLGSGYTIYIGLVGQE